MAVRLAHSEPPRDQPKACNAGEPREHHRDFFAVVLDGRVEHRGCNEDDHEREQSKRHVGAETSRSVLTPLRPSMPDKKFSTGSTTCTPATCWTGGGVGATAAGLIGTAVGDGDGVGVSVGVAVGAATKAATIGGVGVGGGGSSGSGVGSTAVAVGIAVGTTVGSDVGSGCWGCTKVVGVGGTGVGGTGVGGTGVGGTGVGGTGVGGSGVGGTSVGGTSVGGTSVGASVGETWGLQPGPPPRGLPVDSSGCSQWSGGGTAATCAGRTRSSGQRQDGKRRGCAQEGTASLAIHVG